MSTYTYTVVEGSTLTFGADTVTITTTGGAEPGFPSFSGDYGANAIDDNTAGLKLYNSGSIIGAISAPGGVATLGGIGLDLTASALVKNYGHIDGGRGNTLGSPNGGTGGEAVQLTGGNLDNYFSIAGGAGSYGGNGGVGVYVNGGTVLNLGGTFNGGTHNADIQGGSADGNYGGTAGTGILLKAGSVSNGSTTATLSSSIGGGNSVGSGTSNVGNGGIGVRMYADTSLKNYDNIAGGVGGEGAGTQGGAGVEAGLNTDADAGQGITIVNSLHIGGAYGTQAGGAGVYLAAGAQLTNSVGASITGGDTYSGQGGAGLDLAGSGAGATNAGTISGGNDVLATAIGAGAGVEVAAGTALSNSGLIRGGYGANSTQADGGVGVYLNGGTVTTSGRIYGGSNSNNYNLVANAVQFGPSTGGALIIDSGASFSGDLGGFRPGDTVDITNLTYGTGQFVAGNGYETLSTPEGVLTFSGLDPGEYLKFAPDGGTGTDVIASTQSSTIDHAVYQTVTLVNTPNPLYPQYATPLTITSTGSVDPTLSGPGATGVFSNSGGVTLTNDGAISGGQAGTVGGTGGTGVDMQVVASVSNYGTIKGGSSDYTGDAGGAGLLLGSYNNAYTGTLHNEIGGLIQGGTGSTGFSASGFASVYGSAGGAGAIVNGLVDNQGRIIGGAGGTGGGTTAGAGAVGLQLSGGLSDTLSENFAGAQITGGAGGAGSADYDSGAGGVGLDMSGEGLSNYGAIAGGAGGAPHYFGGAGAGGAGASLSDSTAFFNHGTLTGGAAGAAPGDVSNATGGIGLTMTTTAYAHNGLDGTITGGAGGVGSAGTGGVGANVTDGAYLSNAGLIYGGGGGEQYHGPGGTGGTGVTASNPASYPHSSTVFNSGRIEGGTGGASANGTNGTGMPGAVGGVGGVGVALTALGSLTNQGTVRGGWGGYGGYDRYLAKTLGTGGAGGVGVTTTSFTTVTNLAGSKIYGGHGASSSSQTGGLNGAGGVGGAAIYANGGAIYNSGTIIGGFGGNGLASPGLGGTGGTGVDLHNDAATLTNNASGNITGGASGSYLLGNTALTSGNAGAGVYIGAGTTATNSGTITGGSGGEAGGSGAAGVLQAGGTLTNTGSIFGGSGAGIGIQMFDGVANTSGNVTGGAGSSNDHGYGGAGLYVGIAATLNLTGGTVSGGVGVNAGVGGTGIDLEAGATVQNAANATVYGGVGGSPRYAGGSTGGVGVYVGSDASFGGTTLHIFGGAGGTGGYNPDTSASVPFTGGYGGTGLYIRGGTAEISGAVSGGAGGPGGYDPYNQTVATPGGGGTGVYLDGGTLMADGATFSGGNSGAAIYEGYSVKFGGPSSLLVDSNDSFNGTIGGFRVGDTIDLQGVSVSVATEQDDGNIAIYGGADGTLIFDTRYNPGQFLFTSDGDGGTNVTIACYLRGTRIRAERGEVAIEGLRIGDQVMTRSGALRPIRWIGTRSYSASYAADHREVLPVLITQGALGNELPRRDLRVSPEHAMWIDGVLVPAAALVNGYSIFQEEAHADIAYFHVEFDTHDVILAEGAPSESFVDDDSRLQFDNAAEFWTLYPQDRPQPAIFCAPRVEDGELLEQIRARLPSAALPVWQQLTPAVTAVGARG